MQPSRRHVPTLALTLALALALAGCTFPWQRTQESVDEDSTWQGGRGVQLRVVNDGNFTFDVRVLLKDAFGTTIGESEFAVEPGDEVVRRFAAPTKGDHTASIQYHYTGAGRASTGLDDRVIATTDCEDLGSGSWTLIHQANAAASQWRDEGCLRA